MWFFRTVWLEKYMKGQDLRDQNVCGEMVFLEVLLPGVIIEGKIVRVRIIKRRLELGTAPVVLVFSIGWGE
jgi:hypothetical protein